jgi:hypothetical protein
MLKNKTLLFLQREQYPKERINIFVASEDERIRYLIACPGYQIIIGVPGLNAQNAFISNWLDDDEIFFYIQDDVDGIKSSKTLLTIIKEAVTQISTRKTGLYGVLPNHDGRTQSDTTTTHLTHIVGCFYICRNHIDIKINGLCETEDYERSILYFIKYGSIYRYKGAGIKTKYLGTSGGSKDRLQRKASAVQYLLDRYPGYCNFRDKKGEADLLLNWRAI